MCGFNAACFDSYTRSHLQVDGTPKKNYDIRALRVVPRKSTPCVSSSQRGAPRKDTSYPEFFHDVLQSVWCDIAVATELVISSYLLCIIILCIYFLTYLHDSILIVLTIVDIIPYNSYRLSTQLLTSNYWSHLRVYTCSSVRIVN